MLLHMSTAETIFSQTVWGVSSPSLSFRISRVVVYTSEPSLMPLSISNAGELLDAFGDQAYADGANAMCLAHLFTFRSLGTTNGIAYRGQVGSSTGGVCGRTSTSRAKNTGLTSTNSGHPSRPLRLSTHLHPRDWSQLWIASRRHRPRPRVLSTRPTRRKLHHVAPVERAHRNEQEKVLRVLPRVRLHRPQRQARHMFHQRRHSSTCRLWQWHCRQRRTLRLRPGGRWRRLRLCPC